MREEGEDEKNRKIWYPCPDGNGYTYGAMPSITNLFLPERCFAAGEIRLPIGNVSMGYMHLCAGHRAVRFHPLRPEEFVFQVTNSYDEIWHQTTRGSLLLIRRAGVKSVSLSIVLRDGHYSVLTAFPIGRDHNPKKRKEVLIWKRK